MTTNYDKLAELIEKIENNHRNRLYRRIGKCRLYNEDTSKLVDDILKFEEIHNDLLEKAFEKFPM